MNPYVFWAFWAGFTSQMLALYTPKPSAKIYDFKAEKLKRMQYA